MAIFGNYRDSFDKAIPTANNSMGFAPNAFNLVSTLFWPYFHYSKNPNNSISLQTRLFAGNITRLNTAAGFHHLATVQKHFNKLKQTHQ